MIITNEQTQVNETKKADETAVTTTPRNQVNDDRAAARRAKLAAMTADEINDALFG